MGFKKARILYHDAGVRLDSEIDPVAQQVAIVVGGYGRITVFCVTFVITTARTDIADTAGFTAGIASVQTGFNKLGQAGLSSPPLTSPNSD